MPGRRQAHGTSEQPARGAHVAALVRPMPRPGQPSARPSGEGADMFVPLAEPFPIVVRLLQVIAKDLLVLDDTIAGARLEPVGEALVENRAFLLWQCLIRRVADEEMAEPIHVVGLERTDDLVANEPTQVGDDLAALGLRRQLGDRHLLEGATNNRSPLCE